MSLGCLVDSPPRCLQNRTYSRSTSPLSEQMLMMMSKRALVVQVWAGAVTRPTGAVA